jgi:CheY-like chemotaxis protein
MHAAGEGMVEVNVSDTGCGIPADQIDRVFEPFHTTKGVGKGTGLGLSLTRTIVEGLGGTIRVRSVVGQGTTFVVRIPAATPELADPRTSRPLTAERRDRSPATVARILIVDDDRLVARSLKRAFQPHRAEIAIGGPAGLECLLREPDAFDAVLCDVLMPDLDGVELFRLVRERYPAVAKRFIFVTGAATPHAQAFLDGISNPRVHKPVHPEEVLSLLEQMTGTTVRADGP